MDDQKLQDSIKLLGKALKAYLQEPSDALRLAALSKSFETAFEYTWKYFKRTADKAGMEVYSPRDSLKAALQLGLISDFEMWSEFLNARNLSVHDYIGINTQQFFEVATKFEKEVKKIKA